MDVSSNRNFGFTNQKAAIDTAIIKMLAAILVPKLPFERGALATKAREICCYYAR